MVERQTAMKVRENSMAILANRKEEVASGSESKAGDASTMSKWKRIRLVAKIMSIGLGNNKVTQT